MKVLKTFHMENFQTFICPITTNYFPISKKIRLSCRRTELAQTIHTKLWPHLSFNLTSKWVFDVLTIIIGFVYSLLRRPLLSKSEFMLFFCGWCHVCSSHPNFLFGVTPFGKSIWGSINDHDDGKEEDDKDEMNINVCETKKSASEI